MTEHSEQWLVEPIGQPMTTPPRYTYLCSCGQWTYDELILGGAPNTPREARAAFMRHQFELD